MKTTQLKYKAVETDIRHHLKTLPEGTRIASERDLAIAYRCSFLTIRRALKALVEDGTIFRKVGNGSFVATQPDALRKTFPTPSKDSPIGVLVYHQDNAYSQKVLQMLSAAAAEKNIKLRCAWTRSFGEDSLQQARHFLKEGCSAVILPWFPHEMRGEISAFIQKCPLPVSIPLVIPGFEDNYFGEAKTFGVDLILAIESLYLYFQRLGHANIALLGPNSPEDPVLQTMLSAYTCLIQEKNLPSICGLVSSGSLSMDQLANRWKVYGRDLAIISYDDEHALRFMTAMHKIGLAAPGDFKIIGHNNTEASHFSDPPLSTISQDFYHVGINLLEKAIALTQNREFQVSSTASVRILLRNSCGGRGRITPAFRQEFPALQFMEEGKEEFLPVPSSNPSAVSDETESRETALV